MASSKSPELQKQDKAILRKLTIELIIVAAGYCLVISGYTTLINLQSSINITGGVGEQLSESIRGVLLKYFLCPEMHIPLITPVEDMKEHEDATKISVADHSFSLIFVHMYGGIYPPPCFRFKI